MANTGVCLITIPICYILYPIMTPTEKKKLAVYRMEPELLDGLHRVKERDGLPITWQVRQAIRAWLESKGIAVKPAPGRGSGPGPAEALNVNLL